MTTPRNVYGTHVTTRDSHVGHIDAIWPTEAEARRHWYRHGQADTNGRPFATDGRKAVHDPEHLH